MTLWARSIIASDDFLYQLVEKIPGQMALKRRKLDYK